MRKPAIDLRALGLGASLTSLALSLGALGCGASGTPGSSPSHDADAEDAPTPDGSAGTLESGVVDTGAFDSGALDASDVVTLPPTDGGCSLPAPPDMATRLAALATSIQSGYSGTGGWATYQCTTNSGGPTVRDMLWKAIAEFILPSGNGGNVADAQALVSRAMQSLQPSGFFPWQLCNTTLGSDDANSLEFVALALGILMQSHASQMDPSTVASIQAQIPSILTALACDVTANCAGNPRGSALTDHYTNIWLANAAAAIVLAGVPGVDPTAAASALTQGMSEISQWNQLTQMSGVIEYDSPTYYGADLEALQTAYAYAAERPAIQQALDFVWFDIAANFFPSRESLSGAHSRNYNFLEDYGGVDWQTYMLGWRVDVPQTVAEPAVERALVLELMQHADRYVPSASVSAPAAVCTRVVESEWGNPMTGATRYNYVTPNFTLSSVSGGFDAQDQQFVAEIGNHDLPVISVVVDDTDDPYGNTTVKTGLFSKPTHLIPRPFGIQQNGTLFGLLEIVPNLTSTSLATNVIFPLQAASVRLDDTVLSAGMQTLAGSTSSVLGVRDSGGCVAARILLADPYGSSTAPIVELLVDSTGASLNVGRLVAYHAASQAQAIACTTSWTSGSAPLACRPRAALVMAGAACANDDDLSQLMATVRSATFTPSTAATSTTWSSSLNIGGSVFAGTRNRTNGQIMARTVDNVDMAFGPLCVNGTNLAGMPCP
jgi:hypothetical protein